MRLSALKRQTLYNAVAEHVDRLRVKLTMARKENRDVGQLAESELQFLTAEIWQQVQRDLELK